VHAPRRFNLGAIWRVNAPLNSNLGENRRVIAPKNIVHAAKSLDFVGNLMETRDSGLHLGPIQIFMAIQIFLETNFQRLEQFIALFGGHDIPGCDQTMRG
jgi:hypothetical protein